MEHILCLLIIVGIAFGYFATHGNAMPYNEDQIPSRDPVQSQTQEERPQNRDTKLFQDMFCDPEQELPDDDCRCVNGLWQCASLDFLRKSRSTGSRSRRETPLTAELKNTPCAPNDYFKIDCNTCYCKIDRTGYLCTENISCEEDVESSTTTHVPMSNGAMLIVSDHGAQLIKDTNNNDNNLSRFPKSVMEPEHTSPIHPENGNHLEASTTASAITKH